VVHATDADCGQVVDSSRFDLMIADIFMSGSLPHFGNGRRRYLFLRGLGSDFATRRMQVWIFWAWLRKPVRRLACEGHLPPDN
jgi:hypothetical protein